MGFKIPVILEFGFKVLFSFTRIAGSLGHFLFCPLSRKIDSTIIFSKAIRTP